MVKTVVILGGAYAGVHIAHYLLKTTRQTQKDLKVILVTKNTHFYWNMASVRAVIPGIIKDEEIAQPLQQALSRYPEDSYELVIGTAEALDPAAKTVRVAVAATGAERSLAYDQLVLATGARCTTADVPWKAHGTHDELMAGLHAAQDRIKAARSIVVAGAGPTGVELAAELGFEYGRDKEVTLLCATPQILGGDSIAGSARSELGKLGVEIRTGTRVKGTREVEGGKTEVELEGGETIVVDLYLPTMGLVPNSEYIPARYLNDNKYVVVDDFFRVKDAEAVWAAGDIVSKPRAAFFHTQKQAAAVAKNVEAALQGQDPAVVKTLPFDVLLCSTGRSRGVGRLGFLKVFSIMVYMIKGKTLGMDKLNTYIDGSVA